MCPLFIIRILSAECYIWWCHSWLIARFIFDQTIPAFHARKGLLFLRFKSCYENMTILRTFHWECGKQYRMDWKLWAFGKLVPSCKLGYLTYTDGCWNTLHEIVSTVAVISYNSWAMQFWECWHSIAIGTIFYPFEKIF